jgi:hypothetical protein
MTRKAQQANAMNVSRSLFQRELDDSSSDDDDYFIFSTARIVQTYSKSKRRHGGSVLGHKVIYRDRESGPAMYHRKNKTAASGHT